VPGGSSCTRRKGKDSTDGERCYRDKRKGRCVH